MAISTMGAKDVGPVSGKRKKRGVSKIEAERINQKRHNKENKEIESQPASRR